MSECCGAYCEEVCDCLPKVQEPAHAEPAREVPVEPPVYATCFFLGDGTRIVKKP